MNKDKNYYELINKIVEHQNEIIDMQNEIYNCPDSEEREKLESYITNGYGLIGDIYHLLCDKGYTRDEIDFDVAHT